MKKIFQYLGLLAFSIFISKYSFDYLYKNPETVRYFLLPSAFLFLGVLIWPKMDFFIAKKNLTNTLYLLTNFLFLLLLGFYLRAGTLWAVAIYAALISISIYQVYRFSKVKVVPQV